MARMDQVRIDHYSADELMTRLAGSRIKGGMETSDGLHIYLEGGRILIFTGEFVMAVYREEEDRVH